MTVSQCLNHLQSIIAHLSLLNLNTRNTYFLIQFIKETLALRVLENQTEKVVLSEKSIKLHNVGVVHKHLELYLFDNLTLHLLLLHLHKVNFFQSKDSTALSLLHHINCSKSSPSYLLSNFKVIDVPLFFNQCLVRMHDFRIFIVINPLELVFFIGLVGLDRALFVLGVVSPCGYVEFIDVFGGVEGCGVVNEIGDLSLFAVVDDAFYLLLRGVPVELTVVFDVEAIDHFDGRDDFVGAIHFGIKTQPRGLILVVPLGLGSAGVLVMPCIGAVLLLEGCDLHILSEYLFEGLQLIHVFGFVGNCGVVYIGEGIEGGG